MKVVKKEHRLRPHPLFIRTILHATPCPACFFIFYYLNNVKLETPDWGMVIMFGICDDYYF